MATWKIETRYGYNNKVWLMKNGKPTEATIDSVRFIKDSVGLEVTYHVNCDDSDYYRYEEELFNTKKEIMEAMGVKKIKLSMHELKGGNIIECIKPFTSIEGDKYLKQHIYCVTRINRNSAIVTAGDQSSKYNYRLLYRDEIADNFQRHKIKTKGKVINKALRMENFEEFEEEEPENI